jgi:hypothetical protein
MEYIVRIFFILICMFLFDFLPAIAIVFLIRAITKKKLARGWCISTFILTTISTCILTMLFFGKTIRLGIFDFAIHFIVIKLFLYDKDADSFLDTEREILRKKKIKEKSKEHNDWTSIAYEEVKLQQDKYKNAVFEFLITPFMEKCISKVKDNHELVNLFNDNPAKIKEWVIATINTFAGDLIETGEYHIYRGVLSNEGRFLYKVYCKTFEELKEIKAPSPTGIIDDDFIKSEIDTINQKINSIG